MFGLPKIQCKRFFQTCDFVKPFDVKGSNIPYM